MSPCNKRASTRPPRPINKILTRSTKTKEKRNATICSAETFTRGSGRRCGDGRRKQIDVGCGDERGKRERQRNDGRREGGKRLLEPPKPTAAKRQNKKGYWSLNSNNKATKAVQRTRENRPVRARSRELQLAERQAETTRARSNPQAPAEGRTARERRPRTAPLFPHGHPRGRDAICNLVARFGCGWKQQCTCLDDIFIFS